MVSPRVSHEGAVPLSVLAGKPVDLADFHWFSSPLSTSFCTRSPLRDLLAYLHVVHPDATQILLAWQSLVESFRYSTRQSN